MIRTYDKQYFKNQNVKANYISQEMYAKPQNHKVIRERTATMRSFAPQQQQKIQKRVTHSDSTLKIASRKEFQF